MDFSHDAATQQRIETLESFLAERIVPSEATFHEQLAAQDDRWEWSTVPVLKQLQQEARDLGLNPNVITGVDKLKKLIADKKAA